MKKVTILFYKISSLLFLLPSISLIGISSYAFGKSVICIAVVLLCFQLIKNKKVLKLPIIFSYLLLFYIGSETITIIYSINIDLFLDRFIDSVISILFFLTTTFCLQYMNQKDFKHIAIIILFTLTLNMAVEFSIFLLQHDSIAMLEPFFNINYLEHIILDLNRNRVYGEMNLETFIPFGFYLITNVSSYFKIFSLYIIPITILSFISNFRSRILMSFISILSSSIIFFKRSVVSTILIVLTVGVVLLSIGQYMTHNYGYSVVNRLFLEDFESDVLTIESRLTQYKNALEIGKAYPLTGIGLGQYDYYIYNQAIEYGQYSTNQQQKTIWTDTHVPHNIFFIRFVESGLIGLISYIVLLVYFVIIDFKILKSNNELLKSLILSFWTLNIYSLFNPTLHFNYVLLFWTLRGYIFFFQTPKGFQPLNNQ